jgi:hypothetical protein
MYCCVRVEKIKSFAHMSKADTHNRRTSLVPNADPLKRAANSELVLSPSTYHAWRERVGDQTVRKNAVLALQVYLLRSPEWEGDELEWERASQAWLEQTYGKDNVIESIVHRDETTPHFHALVVPLDEKGKLNARKVCGTPATFQGYQTSYAQAVAHLGLKRGVPKELTGASHETIGEYYERTKDLAHVEAQIELKEEQLREEDANVRRLDAARERLVWEAREARQAATAAKREAAAELAGEVARLERFKRETDALRGIPLVEVAVRLGMTQELKDPTKWRLPDGRPVVLESGEGRRFNFVEEGRGGRGAFDLAMKALETDFKGARAWLFQEFGSGSIEVEIRSPEFVARHVTAAKKDPVPPVLPRPEPSLWEHVFQWLTQVRRLSAELVKKLYGEGKVYADKRRNAVFVHGNGSGAEIVGTGAHKWKGAIGRKDGFELPCGFGLPTHQQAFLQRNTTHAVFVCESAIDAISLHEIVHSKATVISVGGSNFGAAQKIADRFPGAELYAAHDADAPGDLAAERCVQELKMVRCRPEQKDWNEVLVESKLTEELKQKEQGRGMSL